MKNNRVKNMKLLYVAPRYHTNQVPIMHGLQQCGCKTMFLAQYEGVSEVHDYVDFGLLKQSGISKLFFKYIEKKYSPNQAEGKKMLFFIPAFWHTMRTIKIFNPNLVIIRERYITCAVIFLICKLLGIKKCILYVQQPIFDFDISKSFLKNSLKKILFPKASFSPIYYHGKKRSKTTRSDVHFVPLVVEGNECFAIAERQYFKDGIIHLLDIGKYREYKNHFFLVDVFAKLKEKVELKKVKLTIIGQVANVNEEEYFKRLKEYVEEKELEDVIELRRNIPFSEMEELYLENDVLLLPSTYESAGMVILEAMEKGLCVVASIFCGLGSYLEEYQCGYTFDIESTKHLEEIIIQLIKNRDEIKQMGQKSCEAIQNHLLFENYLEELNELTEKEFNYTIYKV